MVNLDKAVKVLVNNTFYAKKADGKWHSEQKVVWDSAFRTMCDNAFSVSVVEYEKSEEKPVERVEKKQNYQYKKAHRVNLGVEIGDVSSKTEEEQH